MKNLFFFLILFKICSVPARTCISDSTNGKKAILLSGAADIYYAFDFNQPAGNKRQSFLYNHNRHNELNVNLAFVKAAYAENKIRANIGFHGGTYVNDNYSAEQRSVSIFSEANIGLSLNQKNTLWLDAGIMPSIIGFETANSYDNWTLTRSLLAENSPYFLSGLKVSWQINESWNATTMVANGWQRIQRLEGNSLPSVIPALTYKKGNITLNWTGFIGSEFPCSTKRLRFFNNFYGILTLKKFGFIAGVDFGHQQKMKASSLTDFWFSYVFITRYALSQKWNVALREEYYQDRNQVIISSPGGFETSGVSVNLDYSPKENVKCRMEVRNLMSRQQEFPKANSYSRNNLFLVSSIAVVF